MLPSENKNIQRALMHIYSYSFTINSAHLYSNKAIK